MQPDRIVWGASTMARHQHPLEPKRRSSSTPADGLEPYKSPRHKLLRFFEKSRDQWKAKCLSAKATVKRLQNRVRFLLKSGGSFLTTYAASLVFCHLRRHFCSTRFT
jgi:hypothetical protein